ncbi:MAG: M15 family metallopeptidase [Bacilli bacterium]|nr:M15 family metallopeptidase [Bacilli bacterium]
MFQILFCNNSGIVRLLYYIKLSLNLIRFLVPIGLIIMISLDLYKNMINSYDTKENIIKKSSNRVISAIIVFCIPTFVSLLIALISKTGVSTSYNVDFATCFQEANLQLVKELEKQELSKLEEEKEAERIKNLALVAKSQAKIQALIEENKKNNSTTGSYTSTTTDLNKQNNVYIENGTFYIPKYKSWDKNTFSGKNCPNNALNEGYNNKYGYNNYFWDMLSGLIKAAQDAGYNLKPSTQGCRSYKTQYTFYYDTYKKQPGRAARPGKSLHGFGIASDLTFYKNSSTKCGNSRTRSNCPGMAWVHDHAKDFGLEFPLNTSTASYREDWHIQPIKIERY